jgi:hypothetical protein
MESMAGWHDRIKADTAFVEVRYHWGLEVVLNWTFIMHK